jgi:hypothetical protein
VFIDDFRSGALWLETDSHNPGVTELQSGLDPASVAGGERSVHLESISGTTSIRIDPVSGSFTLSPTVTETSRSTGYWTLKYGTTSPLNLDLLATGDTAFALAFEQLPYPTPITLWVSSPSSGFHYYSVPYQQSPLILVPFSKFPGVDFSSIDRITIDAIRMSRETRLNGIYTVPEPSIGVLGLLAGTGGLSFWRDKRTVSASSGSSGPGSSSTRLTTGRESPSS